MAIKVEEKSLQLALVKAAGQLGITQDELGYKILEKSNGFLGMFGKKISIEAWRKKVHTRSNERHERRGARSERTERGDRGERGERGERMERTVRGARSSQVSEEALEKRDLTSEELRDLKETLRTFCEGLCRRMTDEAVKVEAILDDERLILDVESDYLAAQFAKNAKLAEAIEHILRKKPRHLRQELPFRIFVDVQGTRRARETELVDMAQDLSNKVHENKRPIVLNYRSSYDRKIIHMALDKDARVYTKSIGSGPNRKLMILPTKDGQEVNA